VLATAHGGSNIPHAPIVYVPALASTQLEMKATEKGELLDPYNMRFTNKVKSLFSGGDYHGKKETCPAKDWTRFWIRLERFTSRGNCWYEYGSRGHSNDDSVTFRPRLDKLKRNVFKARMEDEDDAFGRVETSDYLHDHLHLADTKYLLWLREPLQKKFGYKPMCKANLDGFKAEKGVDFYNAGYDFRRGDKEHVENWERRMTKLIKTAYNNNNNRKVLLVGHSMGCVMTMLYLRRCSGNPEPSTFGETCSPKFLEKYVGAATFAGGPFAGASSMLRAILVREDLDNPAVFDGELLHQMMQSWPITYWMADVRPESLFKAKTMFDDDTVSNNSTNHLRGVDLFNPENRTNGEEVPTGPVAGMKQLVFDAFHYDFKRKNRKWKWTKYFDSDKFEHKQKARIVTAIDNAHRNLGFPYAFRDNSDICENGVITDPNFATVSESTKRMLCAIPQVPMFFLYGEGAATPADMVLEKDKEGHVKVPDLKKARTCKNLQVNRDKCKKKKQKKTWFQTLGLTSHQPKEQPCERELVGVDEDGKPCFVSNSLTNEGDATVSTTSAIFPYTEWQGKTGSTNQLCKFTVQCKPVCLAKRFKFAGKCTKWSNDGTENAACHKDLIKEEEMHDFVGKLAQDVYAAQAAKRPLRTDQKVVCESAAAKTVHSSIARNIMAKNLARKMVAQSRNSQAQKEDEELAAQEAEQAQAPEVEKTEEADAQKEEASEAMEGKRKKGCFTATTKEDCDNTDPASRRNKCEWDLKANSCHSAPKE